MRRNESTTTAVDPICGMTVDEASALRAGRDGRTFYFCGNQCPRTFLSTSAALKQEKKPQGKSIYTCPMHPEVQQNHPGDCPKCGMVLEPKTVTADEKYTELHDMTRRFWIGAALTLPVFVLAMAHMIPALARQSWVDSQALRWMQFAFATPVVWWAGWPLLYRGWHSITTRHLNMFTLISIGVGAAFVFQRRGDAHARAVPVHDATRGQGRRLLRVRGGDRCAGAAWPGTRTPCPHPHGQRY